MVNVDLKSLTLLPASDCICIPLTDLTKLGNDEIVGKLIVTCIVVSNALAIWFHTSLVTVWFEDGGISKNWPEEFFNFFVGTISIE